MTELAVFGYVFLIFLVFVAAWVVSQMFTEWKETWLYELRRSQAFRKWGQQNNRLRGME